MMRSTGQAKGAAAHAAPPPHTTRRPAQVERKTPAAATEKARRTEEEERRVVAEQLEAALSKAREEERQAADAREAEIKQDLQATQDREASLTTLLDSLGQSSITLGPLNWSSQEASKLLAEEAQQIARLDGMLEKVRANSGCMREMIAEQQELQSSLLRQTAIA
jgi:hypothetical protein